MWALWCRSTDPVYIQTSVPVSQTSYLPHILEGFWNLQPSFFSFFPKYIQVKIKIADCSRSPEKPLDASLLVILLLYIIFRFQKSKFGWIICL